MGRIRKSSLSVDCFNDPGQPVEISGKITGIDNSILQSMPATQMASIQPFVINEELTIKRIQNQPGDSAANIKLYVLKKGDAGAPDEWKINPTGIDNAINTLFPEPIQIGAMENAEEDVSKSKSTTTIGKLLGEIIGPIEAKYGSQVQGALQVLKDILDADGVNRAPELTQFDTDVNQKIDNFFPDIQIKLHVPTPELKEVFNKGTIRVYEPHCANGRDISSLGHGAQRSIQMALIRHLAELKRLKQNTGTKTVLLIDEPELYLHPQAIEIVREALKTLSEQGYQVVFSTHSPIMMTSEDISNAILVRKNQTLGTHTRKTLKSAVPIIEQDSVSQMHLLFSLSNSSNILFSEKVILTEGATEQRILPILFKSIIGHTLGISKCALVKQGGVSNTKKSMMVLKVMDLPCKAIVDLDYVFKLAEKDGFIEPNDPDIAICKQQMLALSAPNSILLDMEGWPVTKGSSMSASKAFALLASDTIAENSISSLHDKLKLHNIWVWKKGAIEEHLDLAAKNEATWARFCNDISLHPFSVEVSGHAEVCSCIQWLVN